MAEKTFHSITLPGQDTARVPLTAAEFSTSVAYKVKDYCTYQGKLYRCTTAHAAGAWNASHFTETNIDAELDRKLDIPISQANAPTNPRVGDLWIDNDENSPIYNVDASPTLNSTNAVQSGGTKVALNSLDSRKMEHGVITGDFSASVDYRVGDLVFYATTANGITTRTLYRCTTDHNSAAWNAAHFTATTLEVELQRVRDNEADTDMIGDLFGTKTTYAVGDYCIYNDNLYRCIQAVDNTGVATPAFDPDDWTQVALANEVSDLKNAFNDLSEYVIPNPTTDIVGRINPSTLKWTDTTNGGKSIVIGISSTDRVKITANSTNSAQYAFFSDYPTPVKDVVEPSLIGTVSSINVGDSAILSIPQNAKYLYILEIHINGASQVDHTPAVCLINGISIFYLSIPGMVDGVRHEIEEEIGEQIDAINNKLNTEISIDWTNYGGNLYPTGWRTGWYNSSTGATVGAGQYMRLYRLLPAGDHTSLVVTPPHGRKAVITEYSQNTADAAYYVNGVSGNVNETLTYALTKGHYYGISIGYWDNQDAGDYITSEFTSTIIGIYVDYIIQQGFGQATDKTISQKVLTDEIYTPVSQVKYAKNTLGRYLERGVTIASGTEHEMNFGQFIRKNWEIVFSGAISNFTSFTIGMNYKSGGMNPISTLPRGFYLEIDATTVTAKIRKESGGTVSYDTVLIASHGLTIADYLQIIVGGTDTNAGTIMIECNGQVYTGNIENVEPTYYYRPFVEATNCAISDADFSFSCKDFDKDILLVGDSYTRYVDSRWPYYLHQYGFDGNVCICGHGGAKSYKEAVDALTNLLTIMSPKYVLWALGMNDGGDTDENTPSENWVYGRDKVLELMSTYGFIPVFTTIPNVQDSPSEILFHDGKNKWIRESGYQYIDFALAVGADEYGNWRTGLRESATGRHPSALGAKVLYMQALTDFPQLTISN